MNTIEYVVKQLHAVEAYADSNLGFALGAAAQGIDIWGVTDPKTDGNSFTYQSAIDHCVAGVQPDVAMAAADLAGINISDDESQAGY